MADGGVKIWEDSFVCEEAALIGDVEIGSGTVVSPAAHIEGCVALGRGNLVESGARIVNRNKTRILIIGDNNHFQTGCTVACAAMGDGNVVQMRARLGEGVVVGSHCDIGALCVVEADDDEDDGGGGGGGGGGAAQLADYTAVRSPSGARERRTAAAAARDAELHAAQLQLVAKLLPKSNRLLPANQFHTT